MTTRWNNIQSNCTSNSDSGRKKGELENHDHMQGPSSTSTACVGSESNIAPPIVESETSESGEGRLSPSKPRMYWQGRKEALISSWRNRNPVSSRIDNPERTKESNADEQPIEDHSESSTTSDLTGIAPPIHFDDLLCLPPRLISFVIIHKKRDIGIKKKACHHIQDNEECKNAAAEGDTESAKQNCSLSEENRGLGFLLGVDIIKNPSTKLFEVSQNNVDEDTEIRHLLPPEQVNLLVPGDILLSINDFPCRRCRDESQLYQKIIKLQSSSVDSTTLTFECYSHGIGQIQNVSSPMVQQVTFITGNCDARDERVVDETEYSEETKTTTPPPLIHNSKRFVLKASGKPYPSQNSQILRLDSIPLYNCLENTCARTKDVVLSINTIPCYELSEDDANMVFQSMGQTHDSVNVKFYSPPLSRRESIKRAAVATAGGVLFGTGAIIMATPLHPIGHAMAIGGLGVLGTEFEGPKRAMAKVTDAALRITRSSASSDNQGSHCQHGQDLHEEESTTIQK